MKKNKMNILLLAPIMYMSPTKYSNIVYAPRPYMLDLAEGLRKKGHNVHFFTAPDIKTKVKLYPGDEYPIKNDLIRDRYRENKPLQEEHKVQSKTILNDYYEVDIITKAIDFANKNKIDIIHTDSYLVHFFEKLTKVPITYLMHDPLPHNKTLEYWILDKFKKHNYISISRNQQNHGDIRRINFIGNVYHGIYEKDYVFSAQEGDYLLFIGRAIKVKGLDIAIKASKKLGLPLKIATSKNYIDSYYYKKHIDPLMKGNKLASLVGFVSGQRKINLLRDARAVLFPISWEEPFGLVMIESMALGTPVVAFDRGSVSEVLVNNKTGFIVSPKKGTNGFIKAVSKVDEVDRHECRDYFIRNFTVDSMIAEYEKVYLRVIANKKKHNKK